MPNNMPNNHLRLENKVAIITGAASGIGEATARLFVENGAFVVIADIQDELGRQVVASIGPAKASYRHCDVSDEKQVEETVVYTVEKYGNLDIMYSNAGISDAFNSSFLEMNIDQGYDKVMAVNARGAAAAIKHAARAMVARKIRGSIICTGSLSASVGGAGPPAYTASKHAVLGLVRSAASELGRYGIRVNTVSPFGVATPMALSVSGSEPSVLEDYMSTHLANLKGIALKVKHVAEAALFLASDESVYISGHNLVVDGGVSVINNTISTVENVDS